MAFSDYNERRFRSSVDALTAALESEDLTEVRRATERDSRCVGRPARQIPHL